MAKGNQNTVKKEQSPNPQGSSKKDGKQNGLVFTLLAFLTAIVVITAVLGGAFYFVINKNINGLAERYRKEINAIPVLRLALPKAPDPEDPKYMTADQLKDKYQELRKLKAELEKQLEEAGAKMQELQKYKDDQGKFTAELEREKNDLKQQQLQIDDKIKKLEEDKGKLDELVVNNNKGGFKEFFEKVDPANAERLYKEVVKEQKADEEAIKFAKIYETMDPSSAAKIFENLDSSKIELIVETLKNMKKEVSSEILASMDPAFAAKITVKLREGQEQQPVVGQ